MSWAGEHQRVILWVVLILAISAAAVVGYMTWNTHQTALANMDLGKAMHTFAAQLRPAGTPADPLTPSFTSIAERGKAAEKEFDAIAARYPHTKPGKIARYMAGTAAMQAGDTAAAESDLKTAADSGDQDIAALAKMALATLYRSQNRRGDAAKIYKELSDRPTTTVTKAAAQLALAEMYESSDPQEAASIYQQLAKEDSASIAGQIANSRLATLKK